jgi:hypothetical protein
MTAADERGRGTPTTAAAWPTGSPHRTLAVSDRNYVGDNYSDTATLRNDHDRFIDDASWGGRRHHGDGRHH